MRAFLGGHSPSIGANNHTLCQPAGPAFSLHRRHITMGNVAARLFAKTEMRILVQGLDAAGMYRRAIEKNPLPSIQIVTAAPVVCYDPVSACSHPPASCCFFLTNAPILSVYPNLLPPSLLRQKRCTLPRLVLRGSLPFSKTLTLAYNCYSSHYWFRSNILRQNDNAVQAQAW